jgi:5,10-methylenetetrahydromethanopterin reductase
VSRLAFWRLLPLTTPAGAAGEARRAEDEGWTGVGLPDTQSKLPDPYVEMTVAGLATTGLQVATAVTNPFTRDAAITAASICSVHHETGGRALLGIGRGDSSLAHLGYAPAPVAVLRRYLDRVQGYLSGRGQEFAGADSARHEEMRAIGAGDVAGGPAESRLEWLDPALPKVALSVAATGPRVIATAAVAAEEVMLAVGVSAERLSWGIETARAARAERGLDPAGLRVAAYLPMVVHEDRAAARRLIAGEVGSYARFSVMRGQVSGPVNDQARRVLEKLHSVYDIRQHFTAGSAAARALDDEVIDTFAIAGPAGYCVDRLHEVAELGISKVFVLRVGRGIDPDLHRQADRDLVDLVLPRLT